MNRAAAEHANPRGGRAGLRADRSPRTPPAYSDTSAHLRDELSWLDLNLSLAALRARQRRQVSSAACVTDQSADALLESAPASPALSSEEAGLMAQIDAQREEITARVLASKQGGVELALAQIQALFSLSAFEVDALVVCLAPELEARYEGLFGYLQDDVTRRRASVDLVLRLLCRDDNERVEGRRALLAEGALFRYGLLEPVEEGHSVRSGLSRGLRVDEGITQHLLGAQGPDPRVGFCCKLVRPEKRRASPAQSPAGFAAFFHEHVGGSSQQQLIALYHGPDRLRQAETARALCATEAVPLLEVDVAALADGRLPFERTVALVFRDAALKGAAVYLDNADALLKEGETDGTRLGALERALEEYGWVTFLAGRAPIQLGDSLKSQRVVREEFPLPAYLERRRLWHAFAGHGKRAVGSALLDELAGRFRFTPREILNALALAETRALTRDVAAAQVTAEDLELACRTESNPRLSTFGRKLMTAYGWDDLVLPAHHKLQLRELIDYMRNHESVFSEWGFGTRHSLGKGVNALFSGPSGTGKTMAAGIVAAQIGLDIYSIDLSTVVSKYIGETEKNLSRIFKEAETSNAVLFFDEADALFGKRSEVKDSHDRYANIEVNYLLQKMEEHEGFVILATNLSKNVDEAFLRRVHFALSFPVPEKEERLQMWQRVFPSQAPKDADIDWGFLAKRLEVSGGNIKNIAIGAAFLARSEGGAIAMRHVMLAAKREYQKIGKLFTKSDFGDYHELSA